MPPLLTVTARPRPAGWNLSIAYRTLPTLLAAGHGNSLTQVPGVITYTAQVRGGRAGLAQRHDALSGAARKVPSHHASGG